jgi:hypothetical protein
MKETLTDYINSIDTKQLEYVIKLYENKGNELLNDKAKLIKDYQRINAYLAIEPKIQNEEDYLIFNNFNSELDINKRLLNHYIEDLKILRTDLKFRTKQEKVSPKPRGQR